MGSSQSSPTATCASGGVSMETPIVVDGDQVPSESSSSSSAASALPTPTGSEYDLMDKLVSSLPTVIDDESRAQVEEYIASCDDGKGPMVACYSMAEYVSLFLRKHDEAAKLYENACFRPKSDRSPNGVDVDGTRAYPPACFNLGQMRLTGKGRTKFDRKEGYELFDRACRGEHGGACFLQAKMLATHPGYVDEGVPYDVKRAAQLMEKVCVEQNDSLSCFTLASMLLRGDAISPDASNVTPDEARGRTAPKMRENEPDRQKSKSDERASLQRDPKKAERLLKGGCERDHAPSCFNLAVMYEQGDDGIPKDEAKAKKYKDYTEEMVKRFGGFGGGAGM